MKDSQQNSFREIYIALYHPLLAYALTLTGDYNLSKDLVQQAFIKVWERKEELLSKTNLKGYMYKMIFNNYLNHKRKISLVQNRLAELKYNAILKYENENENAIDEKVKKLKKIISNLPPKCQEILRMNKFQGMKYKEIAEHLNISIKTVESQMRIAMKKLRSGFNEF